MGRYSSDDSDSREKKRCSGSRSYDRSDSRERTSRRKSKHRHHSPSRSSRQRRSHSSSSEESSRTSQSRNARRNRRSDSRDRSSSSRNRTSGPKHKHRSSRRSRSGSVSRSRHSFHSKSKRSRSRSSERMVSAESDDSRSQSSCKPASLRSEQGLDYLSNAVKAEAKLQMAIKAAGYSRVTCGLYKPDKNSAAADETLKSQGHLATSVGRKHESFEDQQKRANAIEEIDSGGFTQSTFRSTRNEIPMPKGSATDASHAGAMFGGSTLVIAKSKQQENISQNAYSLAVDHDSFMHPYLFVSCEEKMDRWKKKLIEMRETRLQETGGKIP